MASLTSDFDDAVSQSGYKPAMRRANQQTTSTEKPQGLSDYFDSAAKLTTESATPNQNASTAAAQVARPATGIAPRRELSLKDDVGRAEYLLSAGTGMIGQIAGGLSGIVTGNPDNIHKVQDALTYRARTDAGKQIAQQGGEQGNAITKVLLDTPVIGSTARGYRNLNDKLGAVSPTAGAIMYTLPTAAMLALAPGVRGAFGSALEAGKTSLGAIGEASTVMNAASRVEPSLGAKPRVKLNVDGSTTPIDTPTPQGVTPDMMQQPPTPKPLPLDLQAAIDKAGGKINPTALARHTEAASLPVPVEITEGQALGDGQKISTEKNNRGKYPEIGHKLDAQNGQLIQNFDAIRHEVAPEITAKGVDLGQAHIDAYKSVDALKQVDIAAKYKALEDLNGGQFPMDGKAFVGNTEAALDKALKSGSVPADIQRSLDQFKRGRQMTCQDFETLRSDLADTMRTASDGRQKAAANIIRQQLESMPLTPEAAHLKDIADVARTAAKERFAAIEADPAYKAAINDGATIGEPSPLADKFIKNYVVNGKNAHIQKMISNLSADPRNIQIIRAGVMDHLKDASGVDLRTNTGNVSQAGLNGALEQMHQGNKTGLILGDQGAKHVNTLGNVARYTMEQPKSSYVNNSNTTVSALAAGAKELALGALNVKSLGVSGFVRGRMSAAAEKAAMQKSIAPGAGIKLSDFPK